MLMNFFDSKFMMSRKKIGRGNKSCSLVDLRWVGLCIMLLVAIASCVYILFVREESPSSVVPALDQQYAPALFEHFPSKAPLSSEEGTDHVHAFEGDA